MLVFHPNSCVSILVQWGPVGKEVVLVGVEDSGWWWRRKCWKVEVVVKEGIRVAGGGEEGRGDGSGGGGMVVLV